jgi:large subunit ribosomal protein L35
MPKMKSNSGAKKRFSLTGSGKVKRGQAFKRHLLDRKSKTRKNNLTGSSTVHPADEARIKRLLIS